MRIIEADLNKLHDEILTIGGKAESAITRAMQSLLQRDSLLAYQVIKEDDEIDRLENEIDRLATDVMVLRQPMANDLRFTVTVLHVVTIIERIADHAVNIAKRALILNEEPPLKPYIDLPRMGEVAEIMLHDSLQALLSADLELARKTIRRDDEIDDLFHAIYDEVIELMQKDPATVKRGAELLFVIKHLERIADYATNICEMVIYMIEGRIIKHTEEAL
ncbi:MAG: phosphate signaling complex protein PhoU [Acidobacteriota bacterium]